MAYDPDLEPILSKIDERLTAIEDRLDSAPVEPVTPEEPEVPEPAEPAPQPDLDLPADRAVQKAGWGDGRSYYFGKRDDGRFDIKPGATHVKVHATMGEHGLTEGDGATPDTALLWPQAYARWKKLTGGKKTSHWLLIERGYEYPKEDGTRLIERNTHGESPQHPLLVTAYGTGAPPKLEGGFSIYQGNCNNIVLQDIEVHGGAMCLGAENLILDHVKVIENGGKDANFQNITGLTMHKCDILDIHRDAPPDGDRGWQSSKARSQGAFLKNCTGVLIDGNLFDRNGWAEGYDPNAGSSDMPHPPNMYSHNLYIQFDCRDVTVRDNILMRAASFGMQLRPGGYAIDNAFIDNNGALNVLGGNSGEGEGWAGNYSLLLGNLITSAGHKRSSAYQGGLSIGMEEKGQASALVGNIIAHMADPDNPAEQAVKSVHHGAMYGGDNPSRYYDDTIVWRWYTNDKGAEKSPDRVPEGADPAAMDDTTIQNLAAELGAEPTIEGFAQYVRANHLTGSDVTEWFKAGFGIAKPKRTEPATVVFRPDPRGEGFRWDNRLNWSTGDLPMAGDTVDLNGNRVLFAGLDATVKAVDLNGGALEVYSGRLRVTDGAPDGIQVTFVGEVV